MGEMPNHAALVSDKDRDSVAAIDMSQSLTASSLRRDPLVILISRSAPLSIEIILEESKLVFQIGSCPE